MLNTYQPWTQDMETNIPSPGKHTQEWEDGEKLWVWDEQQLSQAKPQLGFLLQNQRNRDLYSGNTFASILW